MAVYRSESPLILSGDNNKDIETLRNYLYERDMELRYILEHLDGENMSEGFLRGILNSEVQMPQVETESADGSTEQWVFTLADDTVVTKEVYVK